MVILALIYGLLTKTVDNFFNLHCFAVHCVRSTIQYLTISIPLPMTEKNEQNLAHLTHLWQRNHSEISFCKI